MEYARPDHCRYEGKWYQRCRKGFDTQANPIRISSWLGPHAGFRPHAHESKNLRLPKGTEGRRGTWVTGRSAGGDFTHSNAFFCRLHFPGPAAFPASCVVRQQRVSLRRPSVGTFLSEQARAPSLMSVTTQEGRPRKLAKLVIQCKSSQRTFGCLGSVETPLRCWAGNYYPSSVGLGARGLCEPPAGRAHGTDMSQSPTKRREMDVMKL